MKILFFLYVFLCERSGYQNEKMPFHIVYSAAWVLLLQYHLLIDDDFCGAFSNFMEMLLYSLYTQMDFPIVYSLFEPVEATHISIKFVTFFANVLFSLMNSFMLQQMLLVFGFKFTLLADMNNTNMFCLDMIIHTTIA